MKKLKKILLINWLYFSKQLIEVKDINFLTGKNGAGKSTVIDALQIVLLGETNARNFNKAANDSSQRTLDGYLRADMDPNNPTSRKGKDFSSYIACEFWDDQKEKSFVAGIVFDCRSDGSRRDQYYIYDGTIPDTCFLVQRRAMDIPALRAYLRSMFGAHAQMYDSNKQYRGDLLAKWNVHSEQVCRMLKKAVSFRPIVNIQQFITENICDIPDKPNIQAMQQNIRDYKQHEKLAERQENKLSALKEISEQFIELQNAIARLQQQKFLTLWAQKEFLEQQIQELEQKKHDCKIDIQKEEVRHRELENEIAQREARKNELIAAREKSDIYQEQNRLQEQQRQLEQEQKSLEKQLGQTILETRREAQILIALCDRVTHWPELEALGDVQAGAEALKSACLPLQNCSVKIFSGTLSAFEKAQTVSAAFSEQLRKAAYEIENHTEKLETELKDIDATLEMLRKNIKDYPTGLLDLKHRIQTKLFEKYHQTVSVEVLADVLEIADGEETWRGAVEGFLNTQKFYLLVEPAVYGDALSIYDGIKREYGRQSFGLVDVGKIREHEHLQPRDDSLAKKVETENPLARSYVDYLLGRVVCCAHSSQLRNHKTAITADGMLYQGYVARPIPKARMEDAFIGRKAVVLRIQRLTENRQTLWEERQQLQPVFDELSKQKKREFLFTGRFLQEVTQRQNEYLHELEIRKALEKVAEKLSKLDLFWLAGLDKQIKTLVKEIDALRQDQSASDRKIGELEGLLRILEYEKLPGHYQQLAEKKDAIQEGYDAQYQETTGLPRYRQELARLKKASVVAKNFGDQCPRTKNEVRQSQEKLFQLRRAYVQQFQPCHFRIEALDNAEFDDEQKRLEENELPKYREKIRKARESAMEQFQNDFLAKLKSSIDQVQDQVRNLNRALKQAQFGTDQYQFKVERNPDYAAYYDMIMSPELMEGEGGLFAIPFQQKYGALIEDLFGRIATSDDTNTNARKQSELQQNIERYTDFRTYLKFDLETTDQNGNRQLLSKTLNTKSGGETQTPFYIAVLASFAQLYRVNDPSSFGNTVRLVVFDEAFNKMDSDRIIESVRLLRKMHLQAIICTPPDKLPDIMPQADCTLLVCKEKYTMKILPYRKEVADTWSNS